jgi:two-component system, cell cycle sensor histidine kinase and response regulator CckA
MPEVLHVLLIEDVAEDAELVVRNLTGSGIKVESKRVTTPDDLRKALAQHSWDIIISDYSSNEFSGLRALHVVRECDRDTPLIFISKSIGEEIAIAALKHGAQDYLHKDKLKRLLPAVQREVSKARENKAYLDERERAESILRASEAKFRTLIENSSDGFLIFDLNLRIKYCSASVKRLVGWEADELLDSLGPAFVHPEDLEIPESVFRQVMTEPNELARFRLRVRHKDETWRLVEGTVSNQLNDPSINGLVLNFRDVTEAASAKTALQKSQERFSKALRSSPVAISISRLHDRVYLDANPAFLKMFGYTLEEFIGRSADELNLWVEPQLRTALIQNLQASSDIPPLETKFRTKSGEVRDVVVVADIIDWDGIPCLLGITQDVTHTKRLEEQYRQAQKMEAVGRLAGGIAHDFNNLLMVMGASTELMNSSRGDNDKLDKYSRQIKDAVDKAARLTRQLLAFSRQQVLQPTVLDLNTIIKDISAMVARLLGEDIKVKLHLTPSLGLVEADRGQIEQVIMNLAVNSRDAMPDGGELTIATTNVELSSDYVGMHKAEILPGSYVMFSISDNGTGMTTETQSHLFEPFFTTKELGKGTGLGLATVYGIVKQSNGWIWPYSELGHGTTFHLYLPRVHKPIAVPKPTGPVVSLEGTETILFVEDEESLRQVVGEYLRKKGYKVIEALDGPSALEASENESGKIHALVTDLIMPGFGGLKLAELLAVKRPDIRVVYISGYTDRTVGIEAVKTASYLQKPFSLQALGRLLRSLLVPAAR